MISFRRLPASALAVFLIVGCGGSASRSEKDLASMAGGTLKKVVSISGKVLVDGEPNGGVNLYLYSDSAGQPLLETRTKPDGTYCWSTHMPCDGVEAGEYKLAFRLVPKLKRNESNQVRDDQFKGKYSDPKKSNFSLTVEAGKPQTDVDYELKTK